MSESTSRCTSAVKPFSMNRAGPKKARHDLGLRLARLDDEPLVGLVVLALVGGEEARADVAELGAEGERARERGAVDDPAGAHDRDVHGGAHGRRQHEAVHRLVADVAGRLEARRDDRVHPLGLSGEGVLDVRDGMEVEHPGRAHRIVEPEHPRMPAGGGQHLQLRAHLRVGRPLVEDRAHDVLGVRLLLCDAHVDRERLVGQRDGEPDPVPHLLTTIATCAASASPEIPGSSRTSAGWAIVPSAPASEMAAASRASVIGPIPPIPACMNGYSIPIRSDSGVLSAMALRPPRSWATILIKRLVEEASAALDCRKPGAG